MGYFAQFKIAIYNIIGCATHEVTLLQNLRVILFLHTLVRTIQPVNYMFICCYTHTHTLPPRILGLCCLVSTYPCTRSMSV